MSQQTDDMLDHFVDALKQQEWKADILLQIASVDNYIRGEANDNNQILFFDAQHRIRIYEIPLVSMIFRRLLAHLASWIDSIRYLQPNASHNFLLEEIIAEANYLNINWQQPLPHSFHNHKELVPLYLRLLDKRNTELSEMGIQELDPYGFEAVIEYSLGNQSSPFLVKTYNANRKTKFFSIEKI